MKHSRGNGPILSKAKAKAKYIIMIAVAGIISAGFLLAVPSDVQGQNKANEETAQAEIIKQREAQLRRNLRKQVKRNKRKADHWFHKRTGRHHKFAHKPTPWFKTVREGRRHSYMWKREVRRQKAAYLKHKKAQANKINVCVRAGWPRHLCPAVIAGTAKAGKPHWHKDPNLAWVAKHESGFRPCVRNGGVVDCGYRGNRAFGLFQFLGSTWGGVGCKITPDATQQVFCGVRYISRRYHSPTGAVNFWRSNRWY